MVTTLIGREEPHREPQRETKVPGGGSDHWGEGRWEKHCPPSKTTFETGNCASPRQMRVGWEGTLLSRGKKKTKNRNKLSRRNADRGKVEKGCAGGETRRLSLGIPSVEGLGREPEKRSKTDA